MGCYSGTAIVVQPLVGVWVDRGGRRVFLIVGAVLTAAVAALFAARPDALGLFPLLRGLQGAAFSVYFIANFTVAIDLVPAERRSQALGIFGISGLISGAVGPALGELLVRVAGFRGLFLAGAILPLLAAAISARLEIPPTLPTRPGAGGEGLAGLVRGVAAAPRLPMTLAAAFGLGQGVMFTFFPTYALDLGVRWVGLFAVAYSGAALIVRATAGGLADRLGRRAVIIPAMALQAGATVGAGEPRAPDACRRPSGRAVPRPGGAGVRRRARIPLSGAHGADRRRHAAGAARPHGRGVHGVHPGRPDRRRGGVRPLGPRRRLRGDVRRAGARPHRGDRPRVPPRALTSRVAGSRGPGPPGYTRAHGATGRREEGRAMRERRASTLAMMALLGLISLGATEPPRSGGPVPSPQEVEVTGVVLEPTTRQPIVLLQGKRDRRPLAMAIGQFEANGIAVVLQGLTPPRPLTHDLFLNVLGDLRASLRRIVVTDLRDDVFYAQLHLEAAGTRFTIDSRPSDAIALALRARVPILVEERVFEKADRLVPKGGSKPTF